MTYFAAALGRQGGTWAGRELDLDDVEDLDGLADQVRDLSDGGPALLLLEEDDEYVAVLRTDSDHDVRTFISDSRLVQTYERAALVMQDVVPRGDGPEGDEESGRPHPLPAGDTDLLADLGTPAEELLRLCTGEGLLPADVITAICERAGCAAVLDDLRGG